MAKKKQQKQQASEEAPAEFRDWASSKPDGVDESEAVIEIIEAEVLEREPITSDGEASAEPERKRRSRGPREDDLLDLAAKAKTKIKLIRRAKSKKLDALRAAIAGLNQEFDAKEDEFVASLSDSVKRVLGASGVI